MTPVPTANSVLKLIRPRDGFQGCSATNRAVHGIHSYVEERNLSRGNAVAMANCAFGISPSSDPLLEMHTQIGVDDCSTDLALRGLPVFRGLIGPMPKARASFATSLLKSLKR